MTTPTATHCEVLSLSLPVLEKEMKIGFKPTSFEEYVESAVQNNPAYTREEITESLKDALRAYKEDIKCINCGNPIWVIGSAAAGWYGCFSCITGEATPEDDYEIDEACF
jgi:hypothetical protein